MSAIRGSRKAIALTLALAGLAACSKGDDGVDSSGNCTGATVSAFNDVMHKARMYSIGGDRSYLSEAISSCTRFENLVGGRSCQAEDLSTGAKTTVSVANTRVVCEAARAQLNPAPRPQPAQPSYPTYPTYPNPVDVSYPSPSKPIGKIDSRIVSDLQNGIELKVEDSSLINQLLRGGDTIVIQGGEAKPVHSANPKKNLCFISRESSNTVVTDGDVVTMPLIRTAGTKLSMINLTKNISAGCMKFDGSAPWTVSELSQVFGDAATISAAE